MAGLEASGHSHSSGGEAEDVATAAQAYLEGIGGAPEAGTLPEAGQVAAAREPSALRRAGGKLVEAVFGALDFGVAHGLGLASHPSGSDHFQPGPRVHQWEVSPGPNTTWRGYTKKNQGNTLGR